MATIKPRNVPLRGGAAALIRAAVESDAAAMLEHQAHMVATDPNTVREPEDPSRTLEEQVGSIREHAEHPHRLLLIATLHGQPGPNPFPLIGALAFSNGARRKTAHHGHFGISVHADWRGRGLGAQLIGALLDWAVDDPVLEKVCLGTFATNQGAYRLYGRLGFAEECRVPRYFKLGPGCYVDDIQMAIYVKPDIAPPGFGCWVRGGAEPARIRGVQ